MNSTIAVCVGRFQPVHIGHIALLRSALESAQHVVAIIGSAWQASTPRNPFSWQQRSQMIQAALSPAELNRIEIVPVRDYYNPVRWANAIARVVDEAKPRITGQQLSLDDCRIALLGDLADPSLIEFESFKNWERLALPRHGNVSSQQIRDLLFSVSASEFSNQQRDCLSDPAGIPQLNLLSSLVPAATLKWLEGWVSQAPYRRIVSEYQELQRYKQSWQSAPFPPVFVTSDVVLRCNNEILLIRRDQAPGEGLLALPGGFIDQHETVYQSALRELREETNIALTDNELCNCLKSQAVFDHPLRSQRGRIITHSFFFDLGKRNLPQTQAADDARSVEWLDVQSILELEDRFHDDHFFILDHFLGLLSDS